MAFLAPALLGTDEAERPLTPAYLYSDRRSEGAAGELRARLDAGAVHQRTGCPLHAGYAPARLAWLREQHPTTFERVSRWLSLGDYVFARLTGELRTSYSLASWSGLLGLRSRAWDSALLEAVGVDASQLPVIDERPSEGRAPEFAKRWPALAHVRWFPPWGDGAASSVGSGCAGPSRIALSIGTTAALRAVLPEAPSTLPPGLWAYWLDAERVLAGGALNEGGGTLAWLAELLRIEGIGATERAATAAPAEHGLTVLPFLSGERSPGWDSAMPAAIVGLTRATTSDALAQAVMEGVTYRLAAVLEQLREVAPEAREVVAAGGAARETPAWLQIVADVLGLPVTLLDEPEATGRGVAVLVLQALGGAPHALADSTSALPATAVFEPRPEHAPAHAAAMQRQRTLYRAIRDWRDEIGASLH